MSDPGDVALPAAFASLRAEREVRDDGRYVIYFSWPEEERPPSDRAQARADRSTAAKSQPWNVSSGPPDEGAPDEGPPDQRGSRV
jgi:hypothetical protein